MLKQFIERPVLATVVSIIILMLGILGLSTLPVTQYPDIAPPTIQVSANYPGAAPKPYWKVSSFPSRTRSTGWRA